jgi:hypothetical protein
LLNDLVHLLGVGDVESEGQHRVAEAFREIGDVCRFAAVAVTRSPRLRAASAQMRPNPREAPVMNHVFFMSIPP